MPPPLDMSLDDLIWRRKAEKSEAGGHRGHRRDFRVPPGGRGYAPGPTRQLVKRNHVRTAPYFPKPKVQVPRSRFEHEMDVTMGTDSPKGTKLYVSNLDYEVSSSDIELLFSDIGHVIHHSIHYDRSGRSKGTAEVRYLHHSDALTAIKKYNDVQLDGKPMKIELVGVSPVASVPVPPITSRLMGKPNVVFQSGQGQAGGREFFRGRGTGGFGLGRGHGQVKQPREQVKPPREKVTFEDLDADLENYRQKRLLVN
ncbi:THO complex subunit 4A-like [Pyrus ussuriensis x Pyrus communis]|uniref:THO complex subunit 4A-like n=1 Tax=Pyrus ussuriensis x Pyrus communis TaxID=2448454 RepID=A0A5N5EZF1_9ROSA|nr:THO complex subunit 4A-like [Pyrus ussuriensis x Pyrus communis]